MRGTFPEFLDAEPFDRWLAAMSYFEKTLMRKRMTTSRKTTTKTMMTKAVMTATRNERA